MAASLDGANGRQQFWRITFPLLRPVSAVTLLLGLIYTLKVVDVIWIMTKGGPVERTTTMVYFIYQAAFKFYEMGYATKLAYALFAMLFVFTLIQLRMYRRADA